MATIKKYRIAGHAIDISDPSNKQGVADLRVRLYAIGSPIDQSFFETVTLPEGLFEFRFDDSDLDKRFGQRRPDFFFKVWDQDNQLLASTEHLVVWKIGSAVTDVIIEVTLKTNSSGGESEKEFLVRGRVLSLDGIPFEGATVQAFDRDLRHEQLLGQSQTDGKGTYQIQYDSSQFRKSEKDSADLVVKAFAKDGSLLIASTVLFNAPPVAEMDLTIPAEVRRPQALFEKIGRTLNPLLEGLQTAELEEDEQHQDLSFLAGETGFEKSVLARFAIAHRLAQQAIQPEFWFALLVESFFQFAENQSLQEQTAAILDSLSSLDADAVRKKLTSSFNQQEIPEALQEKVAEWIAAFLDFVARLSVSETAAPTFIKLALEDANIKDAQKQEKFARLFNEHQGLTPALMDALEKDASFKQEEVADLRTSFQLAELTTGDFSVVKVIKHEFDVRQPEKIRTLAKISTEQWVNVVKEKHAAGDLQLPFQVSEIAGQVKLPEAEVYGKTLERQFREAFPTTAFAGGLERALSNGGAHGIRQAEELGQFLALHENFELLNTPVDEFLENNVHPSFRASAQDENFRLEVKAVQRVFKLAPTFEATDALLADDLHSAQKIYRLGETEFVRSYGDRPGFTPETARIAWNRAADTHSAVLTVVADLKALEAEGLPVALKTGSNALATFPNWNNLFQTGDLCECEQCRSVLSPAAYFADLLMFLKDRKAANPAQTVKDVLFKRRPDLGYLELNCDNALTPLPYVDVVCEVLEDVVDHGNENDLELPNFTAMPTDTATAKTTVAQAFIDAFVSSANDGKEKIALGDDFSLSQIKPSDPNRWVVHGDNLTYLLVKRTSSLNFFAKILRNTKASAAELRAYPQYVNPKAYVKLRQAQYPFALPFDLFAEEVRAAFQKTNLQRWELMRTLRGAAAPNNPTDSDIAAEYFGISEDNSAPTDEKRIILTAAVTNTEQQIFWGESAIPGNLTNVNIVLQKTGLEYNELLALLDLKFINPIPDIFIDRPDPSCDTDKMLLKNLDATKLDRIHRFLRLWRKLKGWKMWELDIVIRHAAIGSGNLNEACLVNLMHFVEVKKRLGNKVSVEQAVALFGNLSIETHFTKQHEKREDALYQNLFLNRRLIHPLDSAFEIDPITGDLKSGDTITAHLPVVQAALGAREADLLALRNLTKVSDGLPYITDDLTLANLSFLYRQAWLAKALKFKAEEWVTLLKLFNQDLAAFTNPQAAQDFLETIGWLKNSGFSVDELNWLLAADRTAKAAVKESDAARFLTALRKELKTIQASYDPAQYDFLTPPTDVDRLTALLTSLLQKLNRDEAATQFFIAILEANQEKAVADLPAGFSFPASITGAPNNLPIQCGSVLRFSGTMTAAQQTILLNDASLSAVTGLLAYQQAIQNLFAGSERVVVMGLPQGFTFPAAITGAPNNLPIEFESVLRFNGAMTAAQQTTLLTDPSLSAVTSLSTYQQAIQKLFQGSGQVVVMGLPQGFTFPITITGAPNNIPIQYESVQVLRFDGLMTATQHTTLLTDPVLAAVTGIASYQEAIEGFFAQSVALKFFEPVFVASLANLPAAVDFKALSDAALAMKISYDAEQRLLRFAGILSNDEKAALDALSANADYRNAVNSLFTQPATGVFPPEKIWLTDADLQFPLRDLNVPANDHLADNLAAAIQRALIYLSKTLAENAVVQQASTQLGLTEALGRKLLTQYALLPDTLLTHLTGSFAVTTGVVEYATLTTTFDGWFWANRVAMILKKWKITLEELERLIALTSGAHLLDFLTLPLDTAHPIASIDNFLQTSRLLRLRNSLPESDITLLEVLEKLRDNAYPSAVEFATDVHLLNDAWLATDLEQLVGALDLAYPADYLLAESWERLQRAFRFLDNLNASADTVKAFAAATMNNAHANTLKDLLRSKFGAETWLAISAEIQDVLRERKRDALTAWLLSQPQPADAPSGKWENTNDLYAYYLLDVEMSACELTSRLVQASGSVQLFVQRCFMGLEPDVVVEDGGDKGASAWRWWKWMRKYRVWEANRKVFLWPENWIEPELKKDRSQFFKDLENELLQNEINQDNVETAFVNYLEKLDNVAQLEIAGFYQEDDGDNAIVHVFGRTTGAEPHLYYYRRYDYRQWTPWEKVDLDIQGDYLIPAVVGKRLFLFWPVFIEVPDEDGNSSVSTTPHADQPNAPLQKTKKKLRLQMAVSDFRQGKWTPKRVSKDFDESQIYDVEIVRKHYSFFPIDRSEIDGRFGIRYQGYSVGNNGKLWASLNGSFEISGCKGVPELTYLPGNFRHIVRPELDSTGNVTTFLKWVELSTRNDSPQNDFTLETIFSTLSNNSSFTPVLMQTPWIFKMSPPWHLSYLDKLLLDGRQALSSIGIGGQQASVNERLFAIGSWLPYFYADKKRSFFVLPSLQFGVSDVSSVARMSGSIRLYYPEVKKVFRQLEDYFEGLVQTWLDSLNLSSLPPAERQQLEQYLQQQFPEDPPAPYTDEQVNSLMKRFMMRFLHYYLGAISLLLFQFRQFHFKNFYHPFVCDFAKLVYNPLQGIPALMSRPTQLKDSGFSFEQVYQPTNVVVKLPTEYPSLPDCYPREVVDFTPNGAYSPYNWELFFHAPLLIANSLSKNQRFEEAREWYHFMFNPLGVESATPGGSVMSKYWITKPFFETTDSQYLQQRIDNILRMLAGDTTVPGFSAQAKNDLEGQVLDWRTNPFEPHRIANYRTVAYQKTVVMKYLDNLIAWGDNLFSQDSMESINEATQFYILAAEILGPPQKKIPPQAKPPLESFNELEDRFDTFSNALVQVENLIPALSGNGPNGTNTAPLPMLYFCIPQNDKLLGYWETVADRLYKIRHCMNIEGVVRQLALFEPPIDPGALVKAVAGGVDISAALADLNAPLPLYRFNVLLQKANEVCSDVKALGGALLSALVNKDAEALALLRQAQENRLLEAGKAIREKQVEEAKENLAGIKKSKVVTETRRNYYRDIEQLITQEKLHLNKLSEAHNLQNIAQGIKLGASIISIFPAIDIGASGFGGSPLAKFKIGGLELGQAASLASDVLSFLSQIASNDAAMASSKAGFDRRWDDWKFQERLAEKELDQLDSQIAAAELRIAIAEKELDNHLLQIENAKATDAFMHSKYTNEELYQWQIGQISGVYFQNYKLAYDLAKRAERCFRFELGLQDSSYINFGYWDSLKKGLLSGEKLQYDLRRLESAYLEQNRRELELTKHISLVQLDPLALVKLRETGRCFIRLPEEIFDLDYPGHYFRRIKSVSFTVPSVTGPYTTISCTLRLLKNSIRINTANGDNGYPRNTDDQGLPADDVRFVENNIPVKSIAASSAQNDSGVFELSFRDERYLPFEGAGAISEWSLELLNDLPANNPDPSKPDFGKPLRQFDYSSISDAILHVKYTAREDAGLFKNGAVTHLRDYFSQDGATPSLRMFNLRQEFPIQWHRFLNPTNPLSGNVFELEMIPSLFPWRDVEKTLKVNTIYLLARCTDTGNYKVVMTPPLPALPPVGSDTMTLAPVNQYGGLHFSQKGDDQTPLGIEIVPTDPPVKWQLEMTRPGGGNLQEDPVKKVMEVEDMLLVLGYEWE